eukprot:m.2459 g.2459  ORF g.2459 m.2459 type:complete len:137 (+) comp8665_c0_seq1:2302-2712(+)
MSGSRTVKNCNFVHNDEIWKDHVHHELFCGGIWPEKWGFLSNEYIKLSDKISGLRETNRSGDATKSLSSGVKLPLILPSSRSTGLKKKSRPFPVKTSAEIGWKSTDPDFLLEKFGKYTRGKLSIEKLLCWPPEGIE